MAVSAPALKQACDALEAQCTPENRPQWPEIIARFDTKPMPGYRTWPGLPGSVPWRNCG